MILKKSLKIELVLEMLIIWWIINLEKAGADEYIQRTGKLDDSWRNVQYSVFMKEKSSSFTARHWELKINWLKMTEM